MSCLLWGDFVFAAKPLYVDVTMTDKRITGNGAGTGSVLAYTNDNGGVNNSTSLFNNTVNPIYVGAPNSYGTLTIPATVPGVPANKLPKFTPPVGLADFTKNPATVLVTTESYNKAPFANTLSATSAILSKPQANPQISLSADTVVANTAYAAARGVDPVPISPGSLELNPTFQISLGIRPGDIYAGTEMGETLDSLSDPLWSLSAYAIGPISSTDSSNLIVTFKSNPSLGLDDVAMGNFIKGAFTVGDDGTAVMSDPITPFDVFYTVPSPDLYSDYANASLATPEPSTFILAAIGIVATLACGCRLTKPRKQPRGR